MRVEAVAFLAEHGFAAAARHPLPADASFRSYTRLAGGPRPALLMDAPPPQEDLGPFLRIGAHLHAAGLSAPEVIAADRHQGLALIEDLGAETMAQRLDAGDPAAPHYLAATGALARLHAVPPPPGLPAWDATRMADTAAATFLGWWWPATFAKAPSEAVGVAFGRAIHAMLAPFAAAGFVHRDFFPANLMPLPGRAAPADVGLLDFQDAALGHPAYDLVSLVEDARRDVDPAVRQACIAHYLDRRPELDPDDYRAAMAAMAAQRHLRVACLWVRLARRDGKPHYLRHGPRCWALLARALEHGATAPLRDFLDEYVPVALRRNPEGS
jgi:aminoglycoside/choline kinase family phosphotransferase